MAFNPFTNFRKYQKFWMATILLLCMVTFVLCTGTGTGDLSDRLLRWFGSRGQAYTSIDGANFYSKEAYAIKEHRNIANDFMRRVGKEVLKNMDNVLKPENFKKHENNPKERQQLFEIQRLRSTLDMILRRPRFFGEMGVKIDDIVDFKVWLLEADRLNIHLTETAVRELAELELGGREWFNADVYRQGFYEVYNLHNRADEAMVWQSLRDEFRVRLAQRVLGQAGGTRIALSPGQMWEYYKEKRVEYKLALLPMFVEDFVAKLSPPSELDLSILFEKNKSVAYDPASPTFGFAIPGRVKAAWVSADPNSKFYKKSSKAAVLLQTAPIPGPVWPGLQVLGAQLAKAVAAETPFAQQLRTGRYDIAGLNEEGLDVSLAAWLTQNEPTALAAVIGMAALRNDAGLLAGGAALRSTAALGAHLKKDLYQAGLQDKAKMRAPIFATLVGLGSAQQGLAIPLVVDNFRSQPKFNFDHVPLVMVQDAMMSVIERRLAEKWIHTGMQLLKKKLEEPNVSTRLAIERVLLKYGQGFELEQAETKESHSKYTINQAKELEPLRKSFERYVTDININILEGRTEPDKVLKKDDFWKLFFDSSEPFSVTGNKYQVKPWPPIVKIQSSRVQQARLAPKSQADLFIAQRAEGNADANQPIEINLFTDAERPFLFWKTWDEPPLTPEKIDQVRDKVVEAWKLNKARESIVLPRARKIAEMIEKGAAPNLLLMQAFDELKKEFDLKREVIYLGAPGPAVAPLVPQTGFGDITRAYVEYELENGLIPYPRKDTAGNILGLYDLKKPIETGYAPLDEINKALFAELESDKKAKGRFVQILTNEPQNAFYVAIIREEPRVNPVDFTQRVVPQAFNHDLLFDRGQAEAGKRMREELTRQLRTAHRVEAVKDDVKKHFDTDATN